VCFIDIAWALHNYGPEYGVSVFMKKCYEMLFLCSKKRGWFLLALDFGLLVQFELDFN